MSFQASRESWQVADSVLHTPALSDEVYYNAATILRHKLLHDYRDLPDAASRLSFRHSLLAHIRTFHSSAPVLRTRLALCVSAVCVYGIANGEWPTAVSDVASLLGEQSADSARVMCDVLCELAEDTRDPQLPLDATARARVAAHLSTQLPTVLDRVHRTISASGGNSSLHKVRFVMSVLVWKNVPWQPPSVLSHPVIDSTFAALSSVELESVASQAVMELIRGVDDFCLPPYEQFAFDYWDDEGGRGTT